MTPTEIAAVVEEAKRPQWATVLIVMLSVIAVVLVLSGIAGGVAAVYSYSGNDASQTVKESQNRQDCKTVVSSYRSLVIEARDNLEFAGLIATATGDHAGVEDAKAKAPAMKDALAVLPTSAHIVERGWHVPDVARAVAPKLPAYIPPCPT